MGQDYHRAPLNGTSWRRYGQVIATDFAVDTNLVSTAYNANADFRNIKAWVPDLNLPV
jgi:hypothetical protein